MSKEYQNIDTSAIMIAIAKAAYTDMPYAKEIAKAIETMPEIYQPGKWFYALKWLANHSKGAIERATSLEGEYLSTNEAIKKLGDCSVLEIAAGFSTRGLDFTKFGSSIYVESDQPHVIEAKKKIVEKIRADEGYKKFGMPQFISLDALNLDDWIKAGELFTSLGNKKPIAVVQKGLLTYLNDKEQPKELENIKYFLKNYSPDGAFITPDFSFKAEESKLLIQFVRYMIELKTHRKMNYFTPEKADRLLDEVDLKSELLPNISIVSNISAINKMNLDPEKVIANAARYQVRYITLR